MGLRKAAAEPLREVVEREHARDLPGLLAALKTGDAEQRRWAARDLAAHPPAAATLGAQLLAERDASVREALFTSLATHASDEAANALLPLLRSEDAGLRNGAIEALAAMPGVTGQRIAALLRDADPDVRIFTVNLLGDLRHAQVPRWLVEVLEHEPAVNVVCAAIEVLAEVGGAEHLVALDAAARRFAADPFVGFAASVAADRIRGQA